MNFQAQFAAFHPSLYIPAHPAHHIFASSNNDNLSYSMQKASELLPNSRKIQKKRSKYQRIDDNIRQKLVDAVTKEGQMLKAAAKKLKINYSSAKSIFHTYRKEGRINKKAVRERFGRKNSSLAHLNRSKAAIASAEASEITSENSDSPKQSTQSPLDKLPINTTFSSLADQNSNVTQNVKVENCEAPQIDSKLTTSDDCSPQKMTKMMVPNNACISVPSMHQNANLMQNMINQANNIKLYEELSRFQRATPAVLPFMYGNIQAQAQNTFTPFASFPSTMPMLALQKQMQAFPFAGFKGMEGHIQLNSGVPMVNGYPYQQAMFPLNFKN